MANQFEGLAESVLDKTPYISKTTKVKKRTNQFEGLAESIVSQQQERQKQWDIQEPVRKRQEKIQTLYKEAETSYQQAQKASSLKGTLSGMAEILQTPQGWGKAAKATITGAGKSILGPAVGIAGLEQKLIPSAVYGGPEKKQAVAEKFQKAEKVLQPKFEELGSYMAAEVAQVLTGQSVLNNALTKVPTISKFASTFPKLYKTVTLSGVQPLFGTAYGQLRMPMESTYQQRVKQAAIDFPSWLIWGNASQFRKVISTPIYFSLGYTQAKLDGASNEDAIISGIASAGVGYAFQVIGGKDQDNFKNIKSNIDSDADLTLAKYGIYDKNSYYKATHLYSPKLYNRVDPSGNIIPNPLNITQEEASVIFKKISTAWEAKEKSFSQLPDTVLNELRQIFGVGKTVKPEGPYGLIEGKVKGGIPNIPITGAEIPIAKTQKTGVPKPETPISPVRQYSIINEKINKLTPEQKKIYDVNYKYEVEFGKSPEEARYIALFRAQQNVPAVVPETQQKIVSEAIAEFENKVLERADKGKPLIKSQPTITPEPQKPTQEVITPQKQVVKPIVQETEIKRVSNNILKNNLGITQKDAEAMARDVIENRKFNQPPKAIEKPERIKPARTKVKEKIVEKPELQPIKKEEITSSFQEDIPYKDKRYFIGLQGNALKEFEKTGLIPKAQQAFGGEFSITDDYGLAKEYSRDNGMVIELKISDGMEVKKSSTEEGLVGDISDIGEGEYLVAGNYAVKVVGAKKPKEPEFVEYEGKKIPVIGAVESETGKVKFDKNIFEPEKTEFEKKLDNLGYKEEDIKKIKELSEDTEELSSEDEPFEEKPIIEEGETKSLFKKLEPGTIRMKWGSGIEELDFDATELEIKNILNKYFTPKEVKFFTRKGVIKAKTYDGKIEKAAGMARQGMIDVIKKNGKIPSKIVYHEIFEEYANFFEDPILYRKATIETMKKDNVGFVEARENLADYWAQYQTKKTGWSETLRKFFWNIQQRILSWIKKESAVWRIFKNLESKKRYPITKEGLIRFKELIGDEELDVYYNYITKGIPVPENKLGAVAKLKESGILKSTWVNPRVAIKQTPIEKKIIRKTIQGTITPEQIGVIEMAAQDKGVSPQVMSQIRNGFTGHNRTRIEELSTEQADELFRTLLELTPDKMNRIKVVSPEELETMKDFIPPSVSEKRFVTSGDILRNLNEKDIEGTISIARPIRKVLTSGDLLPNEKKIGEKIYDTISLQEENTNIDIRNWFEKEATLYKEALKEGKDLDIRTIEALEKGTPVGPKTQELVNFIRKIYVDSLPVMKPLRIRKGYFTHTPEDFLETVKRIGLKEALRGIVEPIVSLPGEKIDPAILTGLDYIVSREKFNPYKLPRSQCRAYSRKLRKSLRAYASLYYYKKNFDPVMPKVLTMKKYLPPNAQKYVTRYLQTVGGRPMGSEWFRSPLMRTAKKAITASQRFEYLVLLGANIPSALGNLTGGTWNNISDIPIKDFALGNKRLSTKQGRKIIDKYRLTQQTLWLEPVGGVTERLSKGERALFSFMQFGEFYNRGSAALSRIPENEFQSGVLSDRTRAIIRRQLGRTQGLFGAGQAPLLSQHPLMKPVWMFKHWMGNEIELWHSFAKEASNRFKRNPTLLEKEIGNEGLKKITKYVIIGAMFYLFGNEFLKKEVRQKYSIPFSLTGAVMNLMNNPVGQDLKTAADITVRIGNGEFHDARNVFIKWIKGKGSFKKYSDFLEEFQTGAMRNPDGELTAMVSKQEAINRFLVGSYTERGQKEQKLNEELSKMLPFENYTTWDQNFGSRYVTTDYQIQKEKILDYIEKNNLFTPGAKNEGGTLNLTNYEITRMFATYNGKVLEKINQWISDAEKLTGQKISDKDKNSLIKRVTIDENDIANWVQNKYDKEIVPRLLRRI